MKTRRDVLKALSGGTVSGLTIGFPGRALAQERLTIVGHAVHRTAATTGAGGDVTAPWRERNAATLEWLTFGIEAINERAFKEAALEKGNVDVAFILDRYTGPQYAHLFEDLRTWQAKSPIPDLAEVPRGMMAAHTFGERWTAMPFRHATHGLHYNTEYFAERGVAGPPRTVAEVVAAAEKLSFTRSDGVRVYGLVINMDDPAVPLDWIRAFGGDFISGDYKVVTDRQETVHGVSVLVDLVKKGFVPKNLMNLKNEDTINFMQQGRAAMTNNPFGRHLNFNDAKASKFSGKIAVAPLPLAVDGKPTPAKTSVWAMAIPRNARNKELSWSLIRHLSLPESSVAETLNGNGPVRPSAYDNPRVQQVIPWARAEKEALASSRLVVPGFANAAKAMDVFNEELGLALLEQKTPAAAMADVKKRVQPLLPT
ncbi:MAG: extracellular solute-binding protein [Burkholderiales bacterium]|nr:extracellular solute-binding protein [Burkholderiales bacterium]